MKMVILQNIVSNNNIYSLNCLIQTLGMQKDQVKVYFCSETESNRHWKLKENPIFDYTILHSKKVELRGKDLFTYFLSLDIFTVLNVENPDRIIVGGWDQFAYQAAVLWGWWHKKEVIIWSGSTLNEPSWRRTIAKPLVWALIACSSSFLAYGTRAKAYLISLGARKELIQIFPNDVNRTYFVKEAHRFRQQKKALKDKHHVRTKRNFIYVGQFIERKGILDLLKSYQELSRKFPDWGLIVVGYGALSPKITQYVQDHALKNVTIVGSVDQYDLPEYYALADCLVLPSREEVWGLVVNEAIASGLEVIVSDVCGCVPDLLKESKLYIFRAGDVSSLQQQMENVCMTS